MSFKYLRFNLILVIFSSVLLATGCKDKVSLTKSGYIISKNDIELFQPNDKHKEYLDISKSTPLISTLLNNGNRKFCSGALIGPDENDPLKRPRILTNFHCFAKVDKNKKIIDEFLDEACANTDIHFNFNISNSVDTLTAECTEGQLKGDFITDLAVFTLSENLPKEYVPLELWDEDSSIDGREAFILHHPDIKQNFRPIDGSKVNLPATAITETDCKVIGDFPKDEWPLDPVLAFSTKHDCDLIHGSSGSALIDKQSNKILGINWGGIEITFKNQHTKNNSATKATYIRSFLNNELESVKEKSKQERKAADLEKQKNATSNSTQKFLDKSPAASCGTLRSPYNNNALQLILLILVPFLAVLTRSAILNKTMY